MRRYAYLDEVTDVEPCVEDEPHPAYREIIVDRETGLAVNVALIPGPGGMRSNLLRPHRYQFLPEFRDIPRNPIARKGREETV